MLFDMNDAFKMAFASKGISVKFIAGSFTRDAQTERISYISLITPTKTEHLAAAYREL